MWTVAGPVITPMLEEFEDELLTYFLEDAHLHHEDNNLYKGSERMSAN